MVREESHLEDMRAALRGDFERLAERRGGQKLMQTPAEEPEPQPVDHPEESAEPEEPAPPSWRERLTGWLTYPDRDADPPDPPPTDGGAL